MSSIGWYELKNYRRSKRQDDKVDIGIIRADSQQVNGSMLMFGPSGMLSCGTDQR